MSATPPPVPIGPVPTPSAIFTAWPRSAQKAAAALLGLATVLLAIRSSDALRQSVLPNDPRPTDGVAYQVDLNQAERAELLQLPAVGESLAQRILDYRQEHGGFQCVEDLRRVKGIGPLTLEKLRPWVCVSDTREPAGDEDLPPRPSRRVVSAPNPAAAESGVSSKKLTKDNALIDLNRATAEELKRLPGIGPKLADAIIAARESKPFTSVDDLRRVRGIGPKTLEKMRAHVCAGGERVQVAVTEQE